MSQRRTILSIEGGYHAGVMQPVSGENTTIGGGLDDDIVLFGDALAPGHLTLSVTGKGRRGYAVTAEGGDLSVNNVALAQGESRTVSLPALITLGDVAMRWSCEKGQAPSHGAVRTFGLLGLAFVSIAVAVQSLPEVPRWSGGAPLLGSFAPPPVETLAAAQPAPALQGQTAARASDPMAGATITDRAAEDRMAAAQSDLQNMLTERDVRGVTLEVDARTITARGRILPEMESRWRDVQHAFDAKAGGDVTLVSLVRSEAPQSHALPPIAAVWRGAEPYIVVRGRKHHVGSTVPEGWQVQEIVADGVTLRNNSDGELVRLQY